MNMLYALVLLLALPIFDIIFATLSSTSLSSLEGVDDKVDNLFLMRFLVN